MVENDLYFNTDKSEILSEIESAERMVKLYGAKAEFYKSLLSANNARTEYLRLIKEWDESEETK